MFTNIPTCTLDCNISLIWSNLGSEYIQKAFEMKHDLSVLANKILSRQNKTLGDYHHVFTYTYTSVIT